MDVGMTIIIWGGSPDGPDGTMKPHTHDSHYENADWLLSWDPLGGGNAWKS